MKRITILILITLILICTKKHKVEIKKEIENSNIITNKQTNYMTPQKFFEINIKISKITKKYNEMINKSSPEEAERLLNELNKMIGEIYNSYNTSEEEMNNYAERHYKEIDEYLKNHKELENELEIER